MRQCDKLSPVLPITEKELKLNNGKQGAFSNINRNAISKKFNRKILALNYRYKLS